MVTHRDKDGNPLELMQWADLYEDPDYRLVREAPSDELLVRTLWEGLDDGVEVAPMYVTGIRDSAGTWRTVERLYWPCTLADAQAQHERVVARENATRKATGL